MKNWTRPNDTEIEAIMMLLQPVEKLLRPAFHGLESIPDDRPLMFVGNHQLYAIDVPFIISGLYRQKRIFLRGLGDFAHFKIPLWDKFCTHFGVVPATKENCTELMRAKECLLEYPGGARESLKGKNQKYKLLWGKRLGFVRLALQHQCTIVPFAAVGIDEQFDVFWDKDNYLSSPLKGIIDRFNIRHDVLVPLAFFNRIEHLGFKFAPPIRMDDYAGNSDEATCKELRDRVKTAIESEINWLLQNR